jgi:lysophospholipase L1-like esterase
MGGPRIVFMGDSITESWEAMRPGFFIMNSYVGKGISGQTSPQMLDRFQQDVIDLIPEVVVILAGTNDIAGNTGPMTLDMIMDNIKSMAEIAKSNDIKVVLCSVLPAYEFLSNPAVKPNIEIPALNELISTYAEEQGHVYLDYFSAMADERNGLPKNYAEDGIHPTIDGFKVMEPLVQKAISEALRS